MKTSKVLLTLFATFALFSCTAEKESPISENLPGIDREIAHESATDFVISARLEQESGQSKTTLGPDRSVLWSAGDRFSLLSSTGEKRSAGLLTYSQINSMKTNETKKVMITSTSYDGSVFGSSGSTWSCVRLDRNGTYVSRGTSITAAQSEANQTRLDNEMQELISGQDSDVYIFTLTKTTNGYTIQNKDGYYIYANNNTLTLSNRSSTSLTMSQPTGTSATSTIVKQNTSKTIANPSLLRLSYVKSSKTYYLSNGDGGPSFGTSTGGWSFFYVYEISGEDGDSNEAFALASGAGTPGGTFTGNKRDGNGDFVALYPYSDKNSFDGETIRFNIPSRQTYSKNSFASGSNVSVGLLREDGSVGFKNLLGTLKLSLYGTQTINSISLEDLKGNRMNGEAALSLSAIKDATYAYTLTGGSSQTTLDCGEGVILDPVEPTDFYISVVPGALSEGFVVTFETPAGEISRITHADNTIHRSVVRDMPAMGDDALLVSYSIENDVVADYMTNVNYTDAQFDNGQTLWDAGNYTNKAKASAVAPNTDQPNPITIKWSTSATGNAVASLYSNPECTKLVQSGTVTASAGKFSFHSLLPDQTYYYIVTVGSGVIAKGAFNTTGKLRMIKLDGGWNVRDMGGWTCLGGKKLPYEKIYRGGMLEYCTADEQLFLYNLGIRSELELRGNQYDKDHGISKNHNIGKGSFAVDHTMIWNGNNDVVYYQKCSDYANDDIMLATTGHNEDAYIQNMAYIMDMLMNQEKPLYFHCKSGADRTGLMAIFIEALLGFSKSDLIKDYELTSFNADDQGLGGRVWGPSCRPINAYKKLMAMSVPAGISTLQQRVYYYLNHYWERRINASDIDSFIMYMLDMSEEEYAPYRPQYEGKHELPSNTLRSIYEK